jgi:hypothetical protein
MPSAAAHLAQYGVSVEQARGFIVANLQSPQTIYSVAREFGVTNQMLAEIYGGVTAADVRGFFASLGFDAGALDPVTSAAEPILPAEYNGISTQLLTFNTASGALSNDAIKQGIINSTGLAAYNNAFNLAGVSSGADGVLSTSDLGFSHLGNITSTAQLESLYFGSLIKLFKSIDVNEAAEIEAFTTANEAALEAENFAVAQNFVNLLISVFEDEAAPGQQLIPDEQIAAVVQLVGQAFVKSGEGAAGFFDSLIGILPG